MSPRLLFIIFVLVLGYCYGEICPHETSGLMKWSDESSWPNNKDFRYLLISHRNSSWYLFTYYHGADITAGGLYIPESIINPGVRLPCRQKFFGYSYGELCPHETPGLMKWSDESSWPNNKLPDLNDDVVIDGQILLDITPPELRSLTINPEARLVWSPAGDYTLTLRYIHIHGRMDIGSEDCPFERNARIVLTGKRGEYNIPGFDEKFIGVDENGTLEIHGQNKIGWTKLTKTLRKLAVGDGIIHEHLESDYSRVKHYYEGIAVYVVNKETKDLEYHVFTISGQYAIVDRQKRALFKLLNDIPAGRIVLIGVHDKLTRGNVDHTDLYEEIEVLGFGSITGTSLLRTVGELDAYVFVTIKGDYTSTIEKADYSPSSEAFRSAIAEMTFWDKKMKVVVESNVNDKTWRGYVNLWIVDTDRAYPTIDVVDDVSTWKAGDKLVITSTDYDWKQAEIATVMECNHCSSTQVRVDLTTKYMHFGEIYNAVDMRAEVALLTRNIVIEGKVEAMCPPENNNCDKFSYDTFGGHVKAKKGFRNVHIEGIELKHMGQQTDLGRYPLHFHMCEDVDTDQYPNPPYLRSNSIHDTFSRCITIHGTHGVTVMDNVCYKSIGHAYFLEDGGEKRTVFDGNLGAGTLKGTLLPTDETLPSTFWITNPLTYLRNNVAAGGDGTGFWAIFVNEPLGPSKGLGFMQPGEAFGTPILEVNNNVAHSNKQTGFFLDRHLLEDGTLSPKTLHYNPRVDPLDWRSDAVEVKINRLTCYKNRQNAWIRGGWINVAKSSFSDSAKGLIFARGGNNGEQFLTDSVMIGDSINIGEPLRYYSREIKGYVTKSRSYPREMNYPIQGFVVYDGPVYLDNVWFDKYKDTEDYKMGAIGFLMSNKFASSSVNGITRAMFGFDDGPETGNRVFDGNETMYAFTNLDGDKEASFLDYDGSLTSFPGYQIVKPSPFYVTPDCTYRQNWNMAYCPNKYGRLLFRRLSMSDLNNAKPMAVRDDNPELYETLEGLRMIEFNLLIGDGYSYTIHFMKQVPTHFQIQGRGVDKGYPMRIGICIPKGATFELTSYIPVRARTLSEWTLVNSVAELDADTVGGKYYFDQDAGLLFLKLLSHKERRNSTTEDCEGYCPYVIITFKGGDVTQGDCRAKAYPKYQREPLVAKTTPSPDVALPATSATPPQDVGAGSTKPFETRMVDERTLTKKQRTATIDKYKKILNLINRLLTN